MSHLVIGKNSFIARHLQNHPETNSWLFASHEDALEAHIWEKPYDSVLNLTFNPSVKQGSYSDFDLILGQKAQENKAHYIALSSRTVYGFSEDETHHVFDEQFAWLPNYTAYGSGKRQVEHKLLDNLDLTKLTILRPSNIFGQEYQTPEPRGTFFGHMLFNLKQKNTIYFDMAPETKRDFMPIRYLTDILVQVVQSPKHDVFNVGSGIGTPCGDIAHWIIEGYGQGRLDVMNNPEIKDSFELQMDCLQENYEITLPSRDDIKQACIDIGKELKDL